MVTARTCGAGRDVRGGTYLIAVHVTAPVGAAGFDDAAAAFTGDFGVVIP